MRLFAVTTPHGLSGRERCASARSSRTGDVNPSSLLAQQLTTRKPASTASKKSSRRSRTAVHPIDLRDLESELELLPDPSQSIPIVLVKPGGNCEPAEPQAYNAIITVLHALDLHNPCQIRSCPHTFRPFVELRVDDAPPLCFEAARHARNHSSWARESRITHRMMREKATQLRLLRVSVVAHCSRHPSEPTFVPIGQSDDIPLSLDPAGSTASQFYPVFRYQTVQNRLVKYFAGKIKLTISVVEDKSPTTRVPDLPPKSNPITLTAPNTVTHANTSEPPNDQVPPVLIRPSLLPANLSDALQLKRKQLKATVAPDVVNSALCKSHDDPLETEALLKRLQIRASHHLVRIGDVHVLEAVGEGVHATVFRAHVDGMPRDVAMKEFRYEAAATGAVPPLAVLRAFEQEYEMLSVTSTSNTQGGRIVSLFGVMLTPRLAIFTDYCSDGSLARCLASQDLWPKVPLHTKLMLGHQIVSGLAELHEHNVVHRDIKTHNIMVQSLLGPHPIAKIGDLGSALIRLPLDEMLHEETGSSGYTAPDVFRVEGYDHRADIWSLGIVLWELLCGDPTGSPGAQPRNPFTGACGDEFVRRAERGERPHIPRDRLPSWSESLLRSCWEFDPSQRPTAAKIVAQFALHTDKAAHNAQY